MGGGADRGLDGIFGEHRAVELHGREVEVRRDLRVLDLHRVVDRHALELRVEGSGLGVEAEC